MAMMAPWPLKGEKCVPNCCFRLEGQHASWNSPAVQNSTSVLPAALGWQFFQRTMLSCGLRIRMRDGIGQECAELSIHSIKTAT